jgi:hypothetical protein
MTAGLRLPRRMRLRNPGTTRTAIRGPTTRPNHRSGAVRARHDRQAHASRHLRHPAALPRGRGRTTSDSPAACRRDLINRPGIPANRDRSLTCSLPQVRGGFTKAEGMRARRGIQPLTCGLQVGGVAGRGARAVRCGCGGTSASIVVWRLGCTVGCTHRSRRRLRDPAA